MNVSKVITDGGGSGSGSIGGSKVMASAVSERRLSTSETHTLWSQSRKKRRPSWREWCRCMVVWLLSLKGVVRRAGTDVKWVLLMRVMRGIAGGEEHVGSEGVKKTVG